MLNPELYDALVALFKSVKVHNPGGPYIDETSCGEYYAVCCPFCNDTKNRLWINNAWMTLNKVTNERMYWLAYCYNEACSLKGLSQMVFRGAQLPDKPVPADINAVIQREPLEFPTDVVKLKDLPEYHPAYSYFTQRGFNIKELSDLWDFSYVRNYGDDRRRNLVADRVAIPIKMDNNLAGWQTRYIGSEEYRPKFIPKYWTATGTKKSQCLYGIDYARQWPVVVVVEGVLDAIRFGKGPAVAVFGSSVSARQLSLITGSWRKGAALFLADGDKNSNPNGGRAFKRAAMLLSDSIEYGAYFMYCKEAINAPDPGAADSIALSAFLTDWMNEVL